MSNTNFSHTTNHYDDIVMNNRTKYCKLCGGYLDINNKCTICGKQYFYAKSMISILLSLLCICLFCTTLYYKDKSSKLEDAHTQLDDINAKFIEAFGEYQNPLTGEYITDAYSYLEALEAQEVAYSSVFVFKNEELYHLYGCEDLTLRFPNAIIMNAEDAISQGYMPCVKCYSYEEEY